MYKLSKKDKKWIENELRGLFHAYFFNSGYWAWSMYPDCDKSELKNIFFEEEFIGILFSQCHKLKIADEITYTIYVYFQDKVLPNIEI